MVKIGLFLANFRNTVLIVNVVVLCIVMLLCVNGCTAANAGLLLFD